MDIKKDVIGIVGGMGSYATLNIFERILNAFDAEKEWERPRIIIDNYCTLPSRSRALLYNEKKDIVINGLANSVKNLIYCGANIIILGSNTAHLFLNDIIKITPENGRYIVNIIEKCAEDLSKQNVKEITLLGTDATVDLGMYETTLNARKISIKLPSAEKQKRVAEFIEIVKQNAVTDNAVKEFAGFLSDIYTDVIVLGCTELPVLYQKCLKIAKTVFDPIESVIKFLKEE